MKIFSQIKLLQSRVSVGGNKHPFVMTIVKLIIANFAILLIATLLAMRIDSAEYYNFWLTLVQVLQWMVVPSAVLLPKFVGIRVLSVIVFIVGLVLFSGTIIALTTTHLKRYIVQKANAQGKLKLSGHFVVLNYNDKLPDLLQQLSYNKIKNTVLVLSSKEKQELTNIMQHQAQLALDNPFKLVNLIVRQGNPNNLAELQDICLSKARAVLIVQDIGQSKDFANMDIVNLLITVADSLRDDCPVVVECNTNEVMVNAQRVIQTLPVLKDKQVLVYCSNAKIGQFMALSIFRPQYVSVLYDLLSFVGFSIYNCQLETTVVQYLKDYTDSLPIYIDSKTVYAISSNPSNLTQKRSIDISQLKNIQQSSNQLEQRIVYIYGNNDKSPHMIDALNHMQGVVKYQIFDENQLDEFVQSIETDTPTIVAILSSDRNDDNVFLALIALQKMYGDNPPCEIIVQIKDPNKQRNIEQFGIKSIIVSSKIVSFFAMQNMLTVGGYMFYETLLSNGGVFDLCIDNANMVLDMDRDIEWQSYVQFVHSVFQSTNHLILPLGLVKDGKNKYFCDGLDKVNRWILKSNDILIYIKYNNI